MVLNHIPNIKTNKTHVLRGGSLMIKHLKKLVNSLAVLFEPRKTDEKYKNLYNAGYIYKWSLKACMKKPC